MLRSSDSPEQTGGYEIVKVRCPTGTEYVVVASTGQAVALREVVRPQIN